MLNRVYRVSNPRICETRFVKPSNEQIICMILQRYDGIKLNGFDFRPTTFNPGSFTESGYSVSVSAFTDGGRFQTTCYETKHGMLITITECPTHLLTTSEPILQFVKPHISKSKTCFVKESFRRHLETWQN